MSHKGGILIVCGLLCLLVGGLMLGAMVVPADRKTRVVATAPRPPHAPSTQSEEPGRPVPERPAAPAPLVEAKPVKSSAKKPQSQPTYEERFKESALALAREAREYGDILLQTLKSAPLESQAKRIWLAAVAIPAASAENPVVKYPLHGEARVCAHRILDIVEDVRAELQTEGEAALPRLQSVGRRIKREAALLEMLADKK